ncbi:hypothetical protein Pcinc_022118 [Petrolisthes cinctipes]|uniref:Chitin-binding type-2 domain-containing protein n=1 Tax=Petrolisthes cinctipes TaxID=88211 RepID=A0AAE1FFC8_PETCI|nr:hypothetical protein Pcinc_022118 [Petrolisthes cinctipes]
MATSPSLWSPADRAEGNIYSQRGVAGYRWVKLQAAISQSVSSTYKHRLSQPWKERGDFYWWYAWRLWTRQRDTILLYICYRPQWQGSDPIHFLHTNLDTLLLQHSCKHLVVIGDMNQHLVARDFEELLTMYGLSNHATFPTHTSGSSLDPVITDLPDGIISCRPLGMVGSSDHLAVLTTINTTADNDEATARVVCGAGVMSFGCEPDCTGKELYDKVTNPRNCSEYYVCDGDGHHNQKPIPCPEDTVFPDGVDKCQPGICNNKCNQEQCKYACDTTQPCDVIPSMYNCNEYYSCLPGGTFLFECPQELPYFDGSHCIVDSNKCCDNPCNPYCYPNTLQTYDPYDCTKFYICLGPGPVDVNNHVSCDAGQHFEVQASRCIDGTECNNICQDRNINWPSTPKPTGTPGQISL